MGEGKGGRGKVGRRREWGGREGGKTVKDTATFNTVDMEHAPALLKNVLCPFPNRQSSSIAIGKAIGYNTAISSITILGGREEEGRREGGGREEEGRREGGGREEEGQERRKRE